MKRNCVGQYLIAFLSICFFSVLLTFVGLRLYYNGSRLQDKLTRDYGAKDFSVLSGSANVDNDTLLVSAVSPQNLSFVNIDSLHIDTRFYDSLNVNFVEKHPQQPLSLKIKNRHNRQPLIQPILYTNKQTSLFLLSELLPRGGVITDVGFLTDKLMSPYRIRSITFLPKQLTYSEFALLLWDCFAINQQWKHSSMLTHRSPHPVFISPKILILIVFSIVGVLFALYLYVKRSVITNAVWAVMVAAWLILDIHYLIEKTIITKNTRHQFGHLNEKEMASNSMDEVKKIAQTLHSVLPKHSPRVIRIKLSSTNNLSYQDKLEETYLNGQLQCYLSPHVIDTSKEESPDETAHSGGFYYVDTHAKIRRLIYDVKEQRLLLKPSDKSREKQLSRESSMATCQVELAHRR